MPFITTYAYNLLTYISPSTILTSTLMILIASKIHLRSKAVNWIAASSFAVYMVYVNPHILTPYRMLFHNLHLRYQNLEYWIIVVLLTGLMYFLVLIIDQVRNYLWQNVLTKFIIK